MPSTPKARVNRSIDTASASALTKRAETVGNAAPTSAIYTGNPTAKSAIDVYVAAGVAAVAAGKKVTLLEQQLVQARNDRDTADQACTVAYASACSQVETYSKTPADIESCGFFALDIVKTGLILPSAILATFDLATGNILIHVKYADKKTRTCIVEISPTPVGPSTYVRLEGTGVKRAVPGYAPGTYEVHAATSNAKGRSDWFGPVAVIVK